MNILFTLCGRAGSKGVKGKNAREFCGYPLVWYSMAAIALYKEQFGGDSIDVVLNTDIGRERLRGYREAMEARGLTARFVSLPDLPANRAMDAIAYGQAAAEQVLREFPRTTAVFASTDPIGIGVMAFCRSRGLRVPEDLSVCGSGDLEFASLPWFEMTTVAFERQELGRKAAELLLQLIRKEERPQESILFDTHLVLRGSTAAPGNR